ncbi:MAG: UDP-3-O-(3-hydroxymyristoyl)glucosamine N-acyltransferase [Planctomycetota bacterium]|jgi:UDP-3-O-[3-hydroxymyristoyl] glucosamine N-acyltransferase
MAQCRLSELCRILTDKGLPARLDGTDRVIQRVNTLEDACEGDVSFFSNEKYLDAVRKTKASAVILREKVPVPEEVAAVRCEDPYAAVTVAIVTLHGYRKHPQWGLSEGASIDPSAKIGGNPNIARGVTIAAGVDIGDNCTIYPGCYIADGVRIGDDCTLLPNVVIYDHCELGNRVTIHSGSVIGEDGVGYAPQGGRWVKIPQVGRAIVGDDVEIGANCTIDRATLGRTEIGAGSKFGNVVVIGHGTKVGPDCLFAGLVGIAGSANVGKHVTLGGQVGVGGHLTVGDDVQAGGQSAIRGDVEPKATILGSPAAEVGKAKRSMIAVQQLPEWIQRIKDLEREVEALRERVKNDGRP